MMKKNNKNKHKRKSKKTKKKPQKKHPVFLLLVYGCLLIFLDSEWTLGAVYTTYLVW